ncbi:CHAT domain-containing protein, partial [Vararia minispora EC-137]
GSALLRRFLESKDVRDIDLATCAFQRSVDCTPDSSADKPRYLNSLGDAFLLRFQLLGDLEDILDAEDFTRSAVQLVADGQPEKADLLRRFGVILEQCFLHYGSKIGQSKYIEDAVESLRRANKLTPIDHTQKHSFLRCLGCALRTRFQRLGNHADIEDAVRVLQARIAAGRISDEHPDKPRVLNDLVQDLQLRFDLLGDVADLERACEAQYIAVELTPNEHPDKPMFLSNLGHILHSRYERFGNIVDMEAAFKSHLQAVELAPTGHHQVPYLLSSLGACFSRKFERFGRIEDIDEAVKLERRAVGLSPDNDPDKPVLLRTLAITLHNRFQQVGEIADIEEAVKLRRRVLELIPHDHPERATHLIGLGEALQDRFRRLERFEDLREAIEFKRHAVNITPDSHQDKANRLNSFGTALLFLAEKQKSNNQYANDAIQALHRAQKLTPDDNPQKSTILNNLSAALISRFDYSKSAADIDCAIRAQIRAVELTPDGHPQKPGFHYTLAEAFSRQLDIERWVYPAHTNFEQAFEAYLRAATGAVGDPSFRLRAALRCTRMCTLNAHLIKSPDQVLRAHKCVLDVIPQVVWLGHRINRRYAELAKIGAAVNAASAAALTAWRPETALEWLEEGRGIVWGQVLSRLRTPMSDLEEKEPNLAAKFKNVSAALEHAGSSFMDERNIGVQHYERLLPSRPRPTLEEEASEHRRLAQEYEQLISRVRKIDGFQNFLRPKVLEELTPTCRSGPIAIISPAASRCDALVLCHPGYVIHVPLPRLTLELAKAMHTTVAEFIQSPGRGASVREVQRDYLYDFDRDEDIRNTLEALWLYVVQPVLSAIESELVSYATDELPHITWCPTGPLAFLPLHAAGIYKSHDAFGAPKTADFVVSSYTPSLSALIPSQTQSTVSSTSTSPGILVISQPTTPGLDPLPSTAAEADKIFVHFPRSVTHLDHTYATASTVFHAMERHEWIHLACHGIQDSQDATESAFHLYDGRLKLSRLMAMSHKRAELAVLSACQTAKGDEMLPEEAVHLAAGMLAAGYRSVVATMWSIADEDGPVLADALYAALKKNLETQRMGGSGLRVAYAVHEAVEKLKETVGEKNFSRWVPFVHFGT